MKKEFNIPEGTEKVTFEQIGNSIVTTFIPKVEEFKEGDFLTSIDGVDVLIFKEKTNSMTFESFCNTKNQPNDGWYIYYFRHSTPEEKVKMIEYLHSIGEDWNSEKMEIVDYRWMPKSGELYFIPLISHVDLYDKRGSVYSSSINMHYDRKIIFKTPEEAIECAKKMLESIK